jgi:hypothetical protein
MRQAETRKPPRGGEQKYQEQNQGEDASCCFGSSSAPSALDVGAIDDGRSYYTLLW